MNAEAIRQHERWKAARARMTTLPRRKIEPEPLRIIENERAPISLTDDRMVVVGGRLCMVYSLVGGLIGPMRVAPKKMAGDVIREVARKHNVTLDELRGHSREQHIVRARHEACWRLRKGFPLFSLSHIGRLIGGRDHTTVLHGIRRHEERCREASCA